METLVVTFMAVLLVAHLCFCAYVCWDVIRITRDL